MDGEDGRIVYGEVGGALEIPFEDSSESVALLQRLRGVRPFAAWLDVVLSSLDWRSSRGR